MPSRYVSFAGVHAERLTREIAALEPALMVYETYSVVAPIVARALGIPYVNVSPNHAPVPSRVVAALREDPTAIRWTWAGASALAFLAVVGTACSFGTYFWLLQRVPASRLALISYVTPVLAMLLAELVGDGRADAFAWAGTGAVVAGIALVVTRRKA